MTSLQCLRHTQLSSGVVNAISSIRSNAMDFLDWLTVLFSFGIALYLVFDGSGLMPPQGEDKGHL